MNMFKNYDLDNLERKCVKELAEIARVAGAEGLVLLKNDGVLPFDRSKTVSVFGRTQIDYVRSGTGSGGLVNVEYSVNIVDGLKGRINLNKDLLDTYLAWLEENPFDKGTGWAKEPWSQKEMTVTDELCADAASKSDFAIVVIGRTAGEDRDNFAGAGSYLLSEEEEQMIATVAKHFPKMCVALNTGNIIDMKWVDRYKIPCVLYCWQGGIEGGNSFADVILGDVSPSGRLTDTITYDITDHPSTKNFGDEVANLHEEDIYVGYRYFETFDKDKVMYPFGYGLSYTTFAYSYTACAKDEKITVTATVKNIGDMAGKTVVEVYYGAPQGKLGKPARELAAFGKTKILAPDETETLSIEFPISRMASYDDITEYAYILEQGEYSIYAGENVCDAEKIFSITLEEQILERLRQNLAPAKAFNRMKPVITENGTAIAYEPVPTRRYEMSDHMKEHIVPQPVSTGNKGITLKDVAAGKATLDDFIMQLTDEELTYLAKGEGMNSPKVTGGTGCCFGGVTDELLAYGIPPVCGTDGPSGIRMDTGDKATSLPNGTCLACTWNTELVEELHCYFGIELRSNDVDLLLGPGMNIHRNPLNGRNFEYFSEDPYLSGMMGAASSRGMSRAGVGVTIKHFACNTQEFARTRLDAVVSERAVREIYLKSFEYAIKEGGVKSLMTSYGRINGICAACNYDLCTSILRDEWKYDGLVMTDWWTSLGMEGEMNKTDFALMVSAQNDIYMVTPSSKGHGDNLLEGVKSGTLDRTFLRKSAKNILSVILTLPAMNRTPRYTEKIDVANLSEVLALNDVAVGTEYDVKDASVLKFTFTTSGSEMAQYVINVTCDGKVLTCALTQAATAGERSVVAKLPTHEGKVCFDFAPAFHNMKVTAYKK